jgi:hypothetical protein
MYIPPVPPTTADWYCPVDDTDIFRQNRFVGAPFSEGTNVQFTPKLDEMYIPEVPFADWYCPVDDIDTLFHSEFIGAPFTAGTNDQLLPKLDEMYIPPENTQAV